MKNLRWLVTSLSLPLALASCSTPGAHPFMAEGVEGRVRLVDDTGLAPSPARGAVAFLPEAATEELAGAVEDHEWPYHGFPLTEEQALAAGGAFYELSSGGRFRTELTGEWLVCYIPWQAYRGEEGALSPQARGCSQVELPARGELSGSVGEGGFQATVKAF